MGIMATNAVEVTMEPTDIPGADLKEPFKTHAMPALRWWLLCRGIRVPIFMEETTTDQQVRLVSTSMKISLLIHFTYNFTVSVGFVKLTVTTYLWLMWMGPTSSESTSR